MTGYPANVGRAPVKIFILKIEDPLRRQMRLQQITRGRVQNAFGFAGRAGGVKNVERMFAVQLFGRTIGVDRRPSIHATKDRDPASM